MNEVLTTTLLNTLALPFAVALAVGLLANRAALPQAGLALALALLAGDLAGQAAVSGWPAVPPQGSVDKLLWLGLGGVALALGVERMTSQRASRWTVAAAIGVAIIWIGWPRMAIPQTEAWLAGVILWGFALWALARVGDAGSGGGIVLTLLLIAATAIVGLYSSSYSMAQLVGALAAALTGAVLATRQRPDFFGFAARLALAGPLIGMIAMLTFYTTADTLALLLLAVVPLSAGLAERLQKVIWPGVPVTARPIARLAMLGIVAALPAAAAVAVAVSRSGPLYF